MKSTHGALPVKYYPKTCQAKMNHKRTKSDNQSDDDTNAV